DWRTNDHSVGVTAAVVGDQNFEVAAIKFTRHAAHTVSKRSDEVGLNIGVGRRSACHGGGFNTIEFVAQFLPLLPFEEFGERHRFPHGEVHAGHCSTLPHWAFSPSSAGRRGGTGCPCGLEG